MELRHLRYFIAVAEELHFARAAERLHIDYGETVDAVTLIPHMLEAFIAGDRGFKKKVASKLASQKPPQRETTPP